MRLPRLRLPALERADYTPTQVRDLWERACSACKLTSTVGIGSDQTTETPTLGKVEVVADGYYRFAVTMPMGLTVRDLVKQVDPLAGAIEATSATVEPVDGMGGRKATLSVDLRPLPTGALEWRPPADQPDTRPAQVKIGETLLGQPVMFNIQGRRNFAPHLLVAGATGAGKTNLMTVIQASVLAGGGVAMYAIDPGEVDVARWVYAGEDMGRQVFARAAIDEPDWLPLLHEVVARMRENRAWIRAHRRSSLYECRDIVGCPAPIMLFLDELHRLLASKAAGRLVRELIREGRKYGVQIVAATQTTTHRDIPTDNRAQFAARSAGAMVNRTDGEVVLGEFASSSPVHELPVNQGHAYLAIVGQRRSHHVRYCYLPDDWIPHVVKHFAPRVDHVDPSEGGCDIASRPPITTPPVPRPAEYHDPVSRPSVSDARTPSPDELERLVYGTSGAPTQAPQTDAQRAPKRGARQLHRPDIDIASESGYVDEHRAVAYDAVNGRDEPCSACGRDDLEWLAPRKGGRRIQVVFLDRDRTNVELSNLAVMCSSCAGRHYGTKAA